MYIGKVGRLVGIDYSFKDLIKKIQKILSDWTFFEGFRIFYKFKNLKGVNVKRGCKAIS